MTESDLNELEATEPESAGDTPSGESEAGHRDGILKSYAIITDRIISIMRKGVVPWRKPWRIETGDPVNLASGKAYRGINLFLLKATAALVGYRSRYWLTFNQARQRGGFIKSGERACPVAFWKILKKRGNREGSGGGEGETEEDLPKRGIPLLKCYNVFNAEQTEGIEFPTPASTVDSGKPFDPIAACEEIVRDMPRPPTILHRGNAACYVPGRDEVMIPPCESFVSAESYYDSCKCSRARSL